MKAHASLHTAEPKSPGDHEISYKGYSRIEIEYSEPFARKQAVRLLFPEMQEEQPGVAITHIALWIPGDTIPLLVIDVIPNIKIIPGKCPEIVFANLPEPLPPELHPIANVAWHLVNDRDLDPAVLPPKLYEAINDELHKHGVPVMKVTRTGEAKMVQKIAKMKSISLATGNA